MTHINRLPREVLLEIFSHLNKYILKNCNSVSRNWQELTTQIVYEVVTLQAFQVHKIKTLLEKNLVNRNDYFKQLQWTRKLKIERDEPSKLKSFFEQENQHMASDMMSKRCTFEEQEFTTLLSYLPNLQEIDLKESSNKDIYMAFLCDADSTLHLKCIERIHGGTPGYDED